MAITDSSGRGAGPQGRANPNQDRSASTPGGAADRSGGQGLDSGTQRHRNRLAEIARVGKATGLSTQPTRNTGISPAGRASAVNLGMSRDFRDVGNSPLQNALNAIGHLLGIRELPPSPQLAAERVAGTPAGQVTNRSAELAFDPAAALGSIAGMALGVPVGPGLVAGQISQALGRPLEFNLGPSNAIPGAPTAPGAINPTPGGRGGVNPLLQALLQTAWPPLIRPQPVAPPPIAPAAPLVTTRGVGG